MAIQAVTKSDVVSKRALERAGENTDERTRLLEEKREFRTKEEVIVAISTLWQRSQQNFILIGKYLIKAKEILPRGEYDAMIANELPFHRSLAFMMRSIAVAIEHRVLTVEECPSDYTTAYRLVSLPADKFELAKQHSLVRPTLRRSEIVEFRRQFVETPRSIVAKLPKSRKAALNRKARLEATIRRLHEEIEQAKGELTQINHHLGLVDDGVVDLEASEFHRTGTDEA